MNENWMHDPDIAHIDPAKIEFLQALVFESQSLSKEQMLPFLMSVVKKGQSNHISFEESEINAIVETIRKYSTPEELDKINKLMALKKKR